MVTFGRDRYLARGGPLGCFVGLRIGSLTRLKNVSAMTASALRSGLEKEAIRLSIRWLCFQFHIIFSVSFIGLVQYSIAPPGGDYDAMGRIGPPTPEWLTLAFHRIQLLCPISSIG